MIGLLPVAWQAATKKPGPKTGAKEPLRKLISNSLSNYRPLLNCKLLAEGYEGNRGANQHGL